MKTSVFCVLLATILCLSVTLAEARLDDIKAAVAKPILMKNGRSSRMHVVYPHDQHLSASCMSCHHKRLPERDAFMSCSADASCHPNTDVADRTDKSYYLAMHRLDSKISCRGCHVAESAKYPGLGGCETCHTALPGNGAEYR